MSLSAVEYHFPHTQAVDELVDELRIGRPCLGLTGGQLGRLRSVSRSRAQPTAALRKLFHARCARGNGPDLGMLGGPHNPPHLLLLRV